MQRYSGHQEMMSYLKLQEWSTSIFSKIFSKMVR